MVDAKLAEIQSAMANKADKARKSHMKTEDKDESANGEVAAVAVKQTLMERASSIFFGILHVVRLR